MKATALAHPNIALIKYWGNRDHDLRIPVNGSFSMNLEGLSAKTKVLFSETLSEDSLILNEEEISGAGLVRVSQILDEVRKSAGILLYAEVVSENNFPTGAGIASSAAAFSALALAASKAAGLELEEPSLSILARHGSGSACRSIPSGFVEWTNGKTDQDSYAFSIAPPEHWDLADCVAVTSSGHKHIGSTQGHRLAETSPLQKARVEDAPRRIDICRKAILDRDFETFAFIVEKDSDLMHAVMMTSNPALFYWNPATLHVMQSVRDWRAEGLPVFYTIDAGPNVHVITLKEKMDEVQAKLAALKGVQKVLTATVGGAARLLEG
ncbi:MAG: diphosphomevalonate decarboxylase [Anaerolineae bacterium]|jgi:diphosphomevalonate decarboxylase|nr:diphosphomevalonate decarboxylase [Anaerolineae bacterium]MBT3713586.1 diphosphomevalonate decarboxylase [Anaerolineae bacterium]MBT4310749.1 diphosphomevalonate decarboxylase [Anaerolineae bacterium]MBT4456837.1 diphosphomevalonate decarboxylase [Anaerolineae bacterium]MBT4842502.1 diphosphomevalonate decarboxylase [Anaerolineae bacterium]